MKKRAALILFFCFSYLLLKPETALCSARDGLLLWYHSIVPVLYPFMLLSNLAIRMQVLDSLLTVLSRPVCALLGCSQYGAFAVLTGYLCGFPMGAKITHDLHRQNLISKEEADYLYGFVNNPSPAFLISFVASDQLGRPGLKTVLLGNVLGASLLYGILRSLSFRKTGAASATSQTAPDRCAPCPATKAPPVPEHGSSFSFALLDACIQDATSGTVRLGAYLVLFSILTGAVTCILPTDHPFSLFCISSIELTNGVRLLASSTLPFRFKFLLINALCTFGGFSALAQSVGIARMDRTQSFSYIKSRVTATLLSILCSLGTLLFCSVV